MQMDDPVRVGDPVQGDDPVRVGDLMQGVTLCCAGGWPCADAPAFSLSFLVYDVNCLEADVPSDCSLLCDPS